MGATECVNSMTCEGGDVKSWLLARKTSFFFNISLVKGSAVDISSDLPFKDGHVWFTMVPNKLYNEWCERYQLFFSSKNV